MLEKYKAMRDTAIDIGKWIKGGSGKPNATQTGNFLEQRAIRNISKEDSRNVASQEYYTLPA